MSEAVAYLQSNPDVDVVYGDCGLIDGAGNRTGTSYLREWELAYAVETCDHCIPQPGAFMRRSAVERAGWLDIALTPVLDRDLWFRIGLVGAIRHVPLLLAHERTTPGYNSQRGHVTAAGCVSVIEKFFELTGVPEPIRERRRRAISNAHLRGMRYAAIYGGHWDVVLRFVGRAVWIDPGNVVSALRQLKACLAAGGRLPVPLRLVFGATRVLALPYRAVRRAWPRRPAHPSVLPS